MDRCPACAERIIDCIGSRYSEHIKVMNAHAKGRHHLCNPMGCDDAYERVFLPLIPVEYAS